MFKTLEVNLIAVMYSQYLFVSTSHLHTDLVILAVHLGLHYVKQNRSEGDLKALIFVGSMGTAGSTLYPPGRS